MQNCTCKERKKDDHISVRASIILYSIISPQVNPWFSNNFNFMEEYTNTWGFQADFCILMAWVTAVLPLVSFVDFSSYFSSW